MKKKKQKPNLFLILLCMALLVASCEEKGAAIDPTVDPSKVLFESGEERIYEVEPTPFDSLVLNHAKMVKMTNDLAFDDDRSAVVIGVVSNVRECNIEHPLLEAPRPITLFDLTVERVLGIKPGHKDIPVGSTISVGVGYSYAQYFQSLPIIKSGTEYLVFLEDASSYKTAPYENLNQVTEYWCGYSMDLLFEKTGNYYIGSAYASTFSGSKTVASMLGVPDEDESDLRKDLKGNSKTFTEANRSLYAQSVSKQTDATTLSEHILATALLNGVSNPFEILDIAEERTMLKYVGFGIYLIPCNNLENSISKLAAKYWGGR